MSRRSRATRIAHLSSTRAACTTGGSGRHLGVSCKLAEIGPSRSRAWTEPRPHERLGRAGHRGWASGPVRSPRGRLGQSAGTTGHLSKRRTGSLATALRAAGLPRCARERDHRTGSRCMRRRGRAGRTRAFDVAHWPDQSNVHARDRPRPISASSQLTPGCRLHFIPKTQGTLRAGASPSCGEPSARG